MEHNVRKDQQGGGIRQQFSTESLRKGNMWALGSLFLIALLIQCNSVYKNTHGGGWFLDEDLQTGISGRNVNTWSSSSSHSYPSYPYPSSSSSSSSSLPLSRQLEKDNNDNDNGGNNNNEPINPHNKICRNYLKKMLEGATSGNDECEGLENAYRDADCSEEITTLKVTSSLGDDGDNGNNNGNDNGDGNSTTSTDDDDNPTIDDFFQEVKCCQMISHYYAGRCLYHQQYASLSLLAIVSVLILCSLVKTMLQTLQINWLPEAGGCILVGAVVGGIFSSQFPNHDMSLGSFNGDLFLFILLPPIIFHASLSIDKRKFRTLVFPIMMFAVVGTFVSAVMTGVTVHYMTRGFGSFTTTETIPMLDSLIFGALISSVDPVATLSLFHSMGVSSTDMLYVVVFGESILNDGVSIAMFESLVMHLHGSKTELDQELISSSVKYFFHVSFISIAIGVVVGLVCTLYFWALRGRHGPVIEVATFFCFALMAYYIADGAGGSGIVSIMVAGFLMDIFVRGTRMTERDITHELLPQESVQLPHAHGDSRNMNASASSLEERIEIEVAVPTPNTFRFPSYTDCRVMFSGVGHISDRAKVHVGFVADVLANLMETSIFAYLGLFLFSKKMWNEWNDVYFVIIGVFACVISRALMVGVMSLVVNLFTMMEEFVSAKLWNSDASNPLPMESQQPRPYIDRNMQVVLLYAGVRGAVSLALAENIPLYDAVTKEGSHYKPVLKAMTNSSIIFTVFVFGASTYYTLKKQRSAQNNEEGTSRRSLMTSLLGSNSLELREEHNTPPWMNQSQSQI